MQLAFSLQCLMVSAIVNLLHLVGQLLILVCICDQSRCPLCP